MQAIQQKKPEQAEQQGLTKMGYSIAEVCAIFGVCRDTIYNEINAGRLKTFKIGPRRRFVSQDALQDFVRQREAETA